MYYCFSFQVGDFGLDIYLTQLIFGVVEMLARFSSIPIMEKLGRKWSLLGSLILAGTMCIIIIFIPAGTRLSSSLPGLPPLLPHHYGFPRVWAQRVRHLSDREVRGLR